MPALAGRWAAGALALQLAQLCAAVNKARDLSTVSQSGLKLWVTVDARVDVDGGRVAQWNDISHGENHPKQNAADKSPMMEVSDSAGEEIAWTYQRPESMVAQSYGLAKAKDWGSHTNYYLLDDAESA